MAPFIVALVLGFCIGWLVRGAIAKSSIGRAKDRLREEQLETEIEKERMKQNRMLDERMGR
jgi:hypothetical protein